MTSDEIAPVTREGLQLSDYDVELCGRLVHSPKADLRVKCTARRLLSLHGQAGSKDPSTDSGIPGAVLAGIQCLYETEGLQRVLEEGVSMDSPADAAAKALALSSQERSFCQQIVGERLGSAGRQRRAQALLLLDEGKSKDTIASETQVCSRTLERLAERCQIYGVTGAVNDAERPGRPHCYPKSEFVPLIREVMGHEPPTTRFRWTATDLRRVLAHHRPEAARMSMPTLRALVTAAGFGYGYAPKGAASMSLSA